MSRPAPLMESPFDNDSMAKTDHLDQFAPRDRSVFGVAVWLAFACVAHGQERIVPPHDSYDPWQPVFVQTDDGAVSPSSVLPEGTGGSGGFTLPDNPISRFRTESFDRASLSSLDNNFTAFPEFSGGLVVAGEDAAMKLGGFVKADFIADLDPMESIDTFDTTQIPIGEEKYRNARFHAKQSRLSFDTRWRVNEELIRAYVEMDFFGGADGENGLLRLRHTYGTIGRFTAGQTWTTFTDPSAIPQTLDIEGAVSNVNRRQGLIRFNQPLGESGWSWAASLENPNIKIEVPVGVVGQGRTESPDFVTHLRLDRVWGETQAAFLVRRLGFQPVDQPVITGTGWGLNLTGSIHITDATRLYSQVTFGEGIGSYRGLPDVVATGANSASILPMFGWMVGCKRAWGRRLTSNLTVSQVTLDDIPGQSLSNLRQTSYLAINCIYNPFPRVFGGVEYLHGLRENQNGQQADANRIQMSFGYYLP